MRTHDLPATDRHDDEVGCTFLQSPAVFPLLPNEECVGDLTPLLAVTVHSRQPVSRCRTAAQVIHYLCKQTTIKCSSA